MPVVLQTAQTLLPGPLGPMVPQTLRAWKVLTPPGVVRLRSTSNSEADVSS